MISSIDQNTILYHIVKNSALGTLISGKVYKNSRPVNSSLQDIVINTVTLTGADDLIQDSVTNVNFHAPNLENGLPDDLFFVTISTSANELFRSGSGPYYTFWCDAGGVMVKDQETGTWYLNYRLRFKIHNNIK